MDDLIEAFLSGVMLANSRFGNSVIHAFTSQHEKKD
jgi:hypothetical protein